VAPAVPAEHAEIADRTQVAIMRFGIESELVHVIGDLPSAKLFQINVVNVNDSICGLAIRKLATDFKIHAVDGGQTRLGSIGEAVFLPIGLGQIRQR
jgi:hypothetical protein